MVQHLLDALRDPGGRVSEVNVVQEGASAPFFIG